MPLCVRNECVNQLAEQARSILKAPTKTDAIRQALGRVVETSEGSKPAKKPSLAERVKAIQDGASAAVDAFIRDGKHHFGDRFPMPAQRLQASDCSMSAKILRKLISPKSTAEIAL